MNTKIIVGIIVIAVFIFAAIKFTDTPQSSSPRVNNPPPASLSLTPIDHITHVHGLAVDVKDSSTVYIATHHGLLVLKNDRDLYQVGTSKDDYMGFSVHPHDPKMFYASGHPSFGGNMGVVKSVDGGVTWKKISEGISGPVDFHAMAVSLANPDVLYGWYRGIFQRSSDGGVIWEKLAINFIPVLLTTHPQDENIVYASAHEDQGIMVSKDKGVSWQRLSPDLSGTFVAALALNPNSDKHLLSSSEKYGLAQSADGGLTWQAVDVTLDGTVLFIAFDKNNSQNVYILTSSNKLYKSTDGGKVWVKIK